MQHTPTSENKSKQQNTSAGSAPPVNSSPTLQQHGRLDAFQPPLLSFGALKTIQRKAAHSSSAQIASLQSTLGNQATRALMRSPAAGAISNVNHYEQEADRIADQVMTLPSLRRFSVTRVPVPAAPPAVQRACACGGHNSGGSCAACAENEGLQRKASAPGTPSRAAQSVSRAVRSTGHALDSGTRAFMERRLGYDFSAVRLHTDAQAAESARAVDAHAYTLGPHIVFAPGQ